MQTLTPDEIKSMKKIGDENEKWGEEGEMKKDERP